MATSDMERLLARDEPGLAEALTTECKHPVAFKTWAFGRGHRDYCACGFVRDDNGEWGPEFEHQTGRVPLAPDSAHVALERWCIEHGWMIEMGPGGYGVKPPWVKAWNRGSYDPNTLAGAVLSALESKAT